MKRMKSMPSVPSKSKKDKDSDSTSPTSPASNNRGSFQRLKLFWNFKATQDARKNVTISKPTNFTHEVHVDFDEEIGLTGVPSTWDTSKIEGMQYTEDYTKPSSFSNVNNREQNRRATVRLYDMQAQNLQFKVRSEDAKQTYKDTLRAQASVHTAESTDEDWKSIYTEEVTQYSVDVKYPENPTAEVNFSKYMHLQPTTNNILTTNISLHGECKRSIAGICQVGENWNG